VLVELSENGHGQSEESAPRQQPAPEPPAQEAAPAAAGGRAADGIREIRRLLQTAQRPPRWPMYLRQLKQYLRAVDPTFDERRFGFESLGDLMRACQRDGLLRVERDRQGGMRIFPGSIAQPGTQDASPTDAEAASEIVEPQAVDGQESWSSPVDAVASGEVVDGAVVQELDVPTIVDAIEAPAPAEKTARRRRREPAAGRSARSAAEPRAPRKPADPGSPPRARKPAAKPRASRRPRPEGSSD
jgi:hypothetical protein